MARIALDSNILIYAEGADDAGKREIVLSLVGRMRPTNILLPMQSAGETLRWLMRKGGLDRAEAMQRIERWLGLCVGLPASVSTFQKACDLVRLNGFQTWDAVILAASAEALARVLLSEDMQHGLSWDGVTIIDPFLLSEQERHELTATQSTRH